MTIIAPIRAEPGGAAWRQTIYYPYQMASLYGRGTALSIAVDGPRYDCRVAQDVNYLDVAGAHGAEGGMVTLFILNRHTTETLDLDMALHGNPGARQQEHHVMEGHDLTTTNGPDAPDRVAPVPGQGVGVEDEALKGRLAPLSCHVVRLAVS